MAKGVGEFASGFLVGGIAQLVVGVVLGGVLGTFM